MVSSHCTFHAKPQIRQIDYIHLSGSFLLNAFNSLFSSSVQVDPFHTLFGVAGLSLLGDEQIKPVNPVFCMPEDVLQRIGLQPDLLSWNIQRGRSLPLQPVCSQPCSESGKPAKRGERWMLLSSSANRCTLQKVQDLRSLAVNRVFLLLFNTCHYVCTVYVMTFMSDFALCFLNMLGFVACTVRVQT